MATDETDLYSSIPADFLENNHAKSVHNITFSIHYEGKDWTFLQYTFENKACEPYKLYAIIDTESPLPEGSVEMVINGTKVSFEMISYILLIDNESTKRYMVFLAHKSQTLKDQINCKIFANQNVKKTITEIAGANTKISIKNDSLVALFVQYEETNLNFLNRFLFYNNCFWFCNYDGSITVTDMAQDPTVTLDDDNASTIKTEVYCRKTQTIISSYNSENPTACLLAKTGSGQATKSYFKDFLTSAQGKEMANYLQCQSSDKSHLIHFLSVEMLLSPLCKLSFDEITGEILHFFTIKDNYMTGVVSKQMPKLLFKMPKVPHFFKATVFAEKQISYNNNQVQILLPFDSTKILASLVQKVAAKNNQSFLAPAKDEEVIVSFLDENLTSILVLGSLFNARNQSIFQKQEFGYAFSNEEGNNKLLLSNLESKPSISMQNQGDFEMECGGSIKIVDKTGDVTIEIQEGEFLLENKKGNFTLTVAGNQKITVSKNITLKCQKITFDSSAVEFDTKGKFSISAASVDISAKSACKVACGLSSLQVKTAGIEMSCTPSSFAVKPSAVEMNSLQVKATAITGVQLTAMQLSLKGIIQVMGTMVINGALSVSGAIAVSGAIGVLGAVTALSLHGFYGPFSF